MELAALFLLVLMPPADATGETAEALTASLHAELGDVTMVLAPDTLVTPAMWQGEKASMHARFVAHVIWKNKNSVTVDVLSNGDATRRPQFHESRNLAFSAADSKTERGRAIALVLAELLRESPAAALIVPHPPGAGSQAASSHVTVDGLFAAERAGTGSWAMGPEAHVGLGINEAFWVGASGRALFASANQYNGFGAGLEALWVFLGSEHSRYDLGLRAGVDMVHEAASGSGEHGQSASGWNVDFMPSLVGRLTVWRHFRLFGSLDGHFLPASMTVTHVTGEDTRRVTTPFTYSKFRPGFALGLELAL
jgi:hypothetical protein